MYLENSWWNVFSNRLGVGGLWVMLVTWSTTQYSFNKLASRWPVSLNLIAFVSTLQKATQMRFFMDKLIVNGYLLNWIFSYQVHNILTQGWSTLHGSWQTDWRGRRDAYDFITLDRTMLLYICLHFFFFIPVLYLHASIWGLPVLILYCIPANSYNCGIIVMI